MMVVLRDMLHDFLGFGFPEWIVLCFLVLIIYQFRKLMF